MSKIKALAISVLTVVGIIVAGFGIKTFMVSPEPMSAKTTTTVEEGETSSVFPATAEEPETAVTITPPEIYLPAFVEASERCPKVPLNIFVAQIHAESGFDPRAESPVGARGIAQFMPDTWEAYAVDGNNDGVVSEWDPVDAIHSAAEYNCALLNYVKKVPGDEIVNMLAAYNSGPGSVRKHKGIPPFPETENYVDKILTNSSIVVLPQN